MVQDLPKILVPPAVIEIGDVSKKMANRILNRLKPATKDEEVFGTELHTHTHIRIGGLPHFRHTYL